MRFLRLFHLSMTFSAVACSMTAGWGYLNRPATKTESLSSFQHAEAEAPDDRVQRAAHEADVNVQSYFDKNDADWTNDD